MSGFQRVGRGLVVLTALLANTGCFVGEMVCRGLGHARESFGCKEDRSRDGDDGELGVPVGGTAARTTGKAGFVGQGFGLMRMMPEQLSQTVRVIGHFEDHLVDENYTGGKLDLIQWTYGVPLGGIDFQATFHRDGSTKAQTVLVSRSLAFQLSQQIFFKDYQRPKGERKVFALADLDQDRPFGLPGDPKLPQGWQDSIKDREIKWQEQVDDLFWRFFSRPPTPDESLAVKEVFLAAIEEKNWTGFGWVAVLYAILAAEEFWHM